MNNMSNAKQNWDENSLNIFTYIVIAPVNASADLHSARTDIAKARMRFCCAVETKKNKKPHVLRWIYFKNWIQMN